MDCKRLFCFVPTQVTRFIDLSYTPVRTRSLVDPDKLMTGCVLDHASFLLGHLNTYFNVYYWFRVVFIHLVPCSALIILNALLIHTMRRAQARRQQLLKQNRKSECRRLAESNLTTLMLVAVVGAFLLVEFPLALLLIVLIVDSSFDLNILDQESKSVAPLWINLFILLSYPLNFFIYCGMSRQFRETFTGLFGVGSGGGGGSGVAGVGDQSQYLTMQGTVVENTDGAGALVQVAAEKNATRIGSIGSGGGNGKNGRRTSRL